MFSKKSTCFYRLMLFAVMLLFALSAVTPALAVTSSETLWAADKVIVAYGDHTPTLHGEKWVYQDNEIRVTLNKLSGFIGAYDVELIIRTQPDGALVGRWYNGEKIRYLPDGVWEVYLYNLALGVPDK